MLRTSIPLASLVVAGLVRPAYAQIGPDAYGYYAYVVSYSWQDISTTGTRINSWTGDSDDGYCGIGIGFNFGFYGTGYSNTYVGTNGYLAFTQGAWTGASRNLETQSAPLAATDLPMICVLWDDWSLSAGGSVYYETRGGGSNHSLIVQWQDVPHFAGGPGDALRDGTEGVTFQLVLFEATGDILFQYKDTFLEDGHPSNEGGMATVGIRDTSGHLNGRRLQWSYRQPNMTDREAILFSTIIPEPGTACLLALGLPLLSLLRRRRAQD